MMDVYHVERYFFFFFFNDTATTEIYTLSLHDALPISVAGFGDAVPLDARWPTDPFDLVPRPHRSEEHTSELQSQSNLVCRLLLEKKKKRKIRHSHNTLPHNSHTRIAPPVI